MTYTPRFSDPRVRRRTVSACESVARYVRPDQVHVIAQSQRQSWFGILSNPLSQWLDQYLLEVVDPYWNMATGQCRKYRLRESNFRDLCDQLGIDLVREPGPEVQEQIRTGEFDYELKSDRWYTTAQFIPSAQRSQLLAQSGYQWHYDIEAAAPTMLLQRAQQRVPDWAASALTEFIDNRTVVRQRIATEAQVTTDQVKTVINAILQGSVLSTHSSSRLFDRLNHDYGAVQRLRASPTLIEIRADIRQMWQCLRDLFPREQYQDRTGRTRTRKLSAKLKSEYYRRCEREVAQVIQRLLRRQQLRFLWVHDGWQCDGFIDPETIQQQVRQRTGFRIRLDWQRICVE